VQELELSDVIGATLPTRPDDTRVHLHWLAVEGVQPTIVENPPPGAFSLAFSPHADVATWLLVPFT
jgi:transcription initiation factor TFIID subunit 6